MLNVFIPEHSFTNITVKVSKYILVIYTTYKDIITKLPQATEHLSKILGVGYVEPSPFSCVKGHLLTQVNNHHILLTASS